MYLLLLCTQADTVQTPKEIDLIKLEKIATRCCQKLTF